MVWWWLLDGLLCFGLSVLLDRWIDGWMLCLYSDLPLLFILVEVVRIYEFWSPKTVLDCDLVALSMSHAILLPCAWLPWCSIPSGGKLILLCIC